MTELIERLVEATKLLIGTVLALLSFAWLTLGTLGIFCLALVKTPWWLLLYLLHPVAVAYLIWLFDNDWL